MKLQKATRKKVKLRMSIAAPTGFGKTYGALLIAFGITNDWTKIAVIDSENGSASLYSHLGEYNTIELEPPFKPEKYVQAIELCEKSGIEVIVIDSATHVWSGEGGLLEFQNQLGGRYQDWAKTTPLYQKWLNAILHSSCHVISTMRKKQAYAMVTEGGKTKVEKKGMEDEIRSGYDYEMTIAFEIINENWMCHTSKDRTGLFAGKPEFVITPKVGEMIRNWCETGEEVRNELKEAIEGLEAIATMDELKAYKAKLPAHIATNQQFKDAGMTKYNSLNGKASISV
jgi:hypothetical protein